MRKHWANYSFIKKNKTMVQVSENKVVWKTIETPQFLQIVTALENAKGTGRTKMLIGGPGIGKTYAINKFCNRHKTHTYRITVSNEHKLEDIIDELLTLLGFNFSPLIGIRMRGYSKKIRIDKIAERLVEIKQNGGKPILIFDEGENMNMAVLKTIKGLYDRLESHCSIVLIGTERLVERILNVKEGRKGRDRESLPELYSRFKAGLRYIKPVTPDLFKPFLDSYVNDLGLRKLISTSLTSYRDLHDHLEPVMVEANETGKPLSEQLYRMFHELM